MNDHHLSDHEVERYQHGDLAPALLTEIDGHISDCAACRKKLAVALNLPDIFPALVEEFRADAEEVPDHVSYAQAAAFVDERLDRVDREIVEVHLEICPECERMVTALRQARQETQDRSAPAILSSPSPAEAQRAPLWQRLFSRLRFSPSQSSPERPVSAAVRPLSARWVLLPVATTALVASLAYWFMVHPLKLRLDNQERANRSLQEQVAAANGLRAQGERLSQENLRLREERNSLQKRYQESQAQLQAAQKANGEAHGPEVALQLPRDIAEYRDQPDTLMGPGTPPAPFHLLAPISTAIESDRPTFQWTSVPEAAHYLLSVVDFKTQRELIRQEVRDTHYTLSAALPRGRVYVWQISAQTPAKAGQNVPQTLYAEPNTARFKLLSQQEARALQTAVRDLAPSRRNLGVIYMNAGLFDAAKQEFQEILRRDPHDRKTQDLLRHLEEARHPKH